MKNKDGQTETQKKFLQAVAETQGLVDEDKARILAHESHQLHSYAAVARLALNNLQGKRGPKTALKRRRVQAEATKWDDFANQSEERTEKAIDIWRHIKSSALYHRVYNDVIERAEKINPTLLDVLKRDQSLTAEEAYLQQASDNGGNNRPEIAQAIEKVAMSLADPDWGAWHTIDFTGDVGYGGEVSNGQVTNATGDATEFFMLLGVGNHKKSLQKLVTGEIEYLPIKFDDYDLKTVVYFLNSESHKSRVGNMKSAFITPNKFTMTMMNRRGGDLERSAEKIMNEVFGRG